VIAVLSPVGVPCGKLTTPADLIASPEMWRLGVLRHAGDGAGGEVTVVENLLGYSGGPMAIPAVGEHTDEVLGRLAPPPAGTSAAGTQP
jgi:crotonobetainyl-CoA:carnitine CoA-transferase CaiB-like acyl-CoA transferase